MEAIKILGEYETTIDGLKDIDQFLENAKLKNTKKVVCICFKKEQRKIIYKNVYPEDYDPKKSQKYLYRSHQSRQFDITPTTKIAYDFKKKEPKINEALKRVQYWFEKFIPLLKNKKLSDYESKQVELLEQVNNEMSNKKGSIREDILKVFEGFKTSKNPKEDEKRNSILTIKIQDGEVEKYVGDLDIFKKIIKEEGFRFIYFRHGVEIRGQGVCSLCGKNTEVYDYFPFKIYSMDKEGFAPEFVQKNAWKRLPVCGDCIPFLMVGGEFLNNYLLKNFYDYKFYVIPYSIMGGMDVNLIKEIKDKKKKEGYEGLLIEDDFFLEPIKKRGSALNLIFMFCEFGQSIKVVKYVEDVPPSWLKQLDITLKETKNSFIFKEDALKKIGIVGKKESGDLKNIITDTTIGGLVKAFFPRSKETGTYSKYFIDIIGDILAQRPINRYLLMSAFMREIRNKHVKEDVRNEKILVLKSLMLLLFLERMNLIRG